MKIKDFCILLINGIMEFFRNFLTIECLQYILTFLQVLLALFSIYYFIQKIKLTKTTKGKQKNEFSEMS